MPDLPSIETVTTTGAIAAVIAAASWLIRWFSGLASQGEDIADRRIAALSADFEAYRTRTQRELAEVHATLETIRELQRKCQAESDAQAVELASLRAELSHLRRPKG